MQGEVGIGPCSSPASHIMGSSGMCFTALKGNGKRVQIFHLTKFWVGILFGLKASLSDKTGTFAI